MSAWPFGALKLFGYDVIVIDPPWPFSMHSIKGEGKSAMRHYDTMPLAEIQALPVGQLARADALLLCWATAPLLDKCIDTVKGWGFIYKTNLAWRKLTRNGKPSMGPGYCARTLHETVILATIGAPSFKPLLSLFDGERRQHSRKPDEFYQMVDRRCPRNSYKADVFSRYERPGWDCWGDEAGKFNEGGSDGAVRAGDSRRERRSAERAAAEAALRPRGLFDDPGDLRGGREAAAVGRQDAHDGEARHQPADAAARARPLGRSKDPHHQPPQAGPQGPRPGAGGKPPRGGRRAHAVSKVPARG